MASRDTTPSSFTLFTSLPLELREQIWRETLPKVSSSVLFSYRRGCWTVRDPAKGETGFDLGSHNHLELLFLYKLLDKPHFDIPIFFVNSEAHKIATTWLCEEGLKLEAYPEPLSGHQHPRCTFARTFRPDRDILYVSDDRSADFHGEPFDCINQPEYEYSYYNTTCEVSRLAVSETLFMDGILEELLQFWNYRIAHIFVIVGSLPNETWTAGEGRELTWWELDSWNGGSFRWIKDSWEIDVETRELVDEIRLLQNAIKDVIENLAQLDELCRYSPELSIQLARAVQR
ncbi:hypothetical protein B0O99DRAFT_643894 [Bisporella sp. PMI_857]|nr:hypothetical protein B0O99DRAFT_643894 [Bisporella sp. PMI_857]